MVCTAGQFVLCLTLCHLVLVCFIPFNIATASLGEERELILVFFVRLFDLCLFGFVGFFFLWSCICGGGGGGLRFVVVAPPGFSPTFFFTLLIVLRRWCRC